MVDNQANKAAVIEANFIWHEAPDAQSLADHLAAELIKQLQTAINQKSRALMALSGGSTPKPLFEALVDADLDWSKVTITLVDERWVPETHELSNAAFLKRHLLEKLPVQPAFLPLYKAADQVKKSIPLVLDLLDRASVSKRFDIVILGMGSDGHTASFFPDAPNIANLVDPQNSHRLLSCESPTTQVPRITWSLPALLNTEFLALHFTGDSKQAVFEQALTSNKATELPIRSAIFQDQVPLQVYFTS